MVKQITALKFHSKYDHSIKFQTLIEIHSSYITQFGLQLLRMRRRWPATSFFAILLCAKEEEESCERKWRPASFVFWGVKNAIFIGAWGKTRLQKVKIGNCRTSSSRGGMSSSLLLYNYYRAQMAIQESLQQKLPLKPKNDHYLKNSL